MSKNSFNNDLWLASYIGDLLDDESPSKKGAASTRIEEENPGAEIKDRSDSAATTESVLLKKQSSNTDAQHRAAMSDQQVPKSDAVPYATNHKIISTKSKDKSSDLLPGKELNVAKSPIPHRPNQLLEQTDRKQRVEKLLLGSALQPAETTTEALATTSSVKTETKGSVESDSQAKLQVVEGHQEDLIETAALQPGYLSGEWNEGRPAWAQNQFDVLLFTVSKLTLAVPLISLGKIQKISDELTPLFGQADWFMGVLPTGQGKIRCVDTALFVMPERYKPECRDSYRFIVSIDGFPWGLAVDEVKQPIQLQPASVNWRGVRTQRPWLAGTIKDHMCALIDTQKLGELLASEDKNSSKN